MELRKALLLELARQCKLPDERHFVWSPDQFLDLEDRDGAIIVSFMLRVVGDDLYLYVMNSQARKYDLNEPDCFDQVVSFMQEKVA